MDVSVTVPNRSSAQSRSYMTGPVGGPTATWAGATTATTLGPSTWIWTWTPPSPLRAVNSQTFLNHPPPSTHPSPTKSWLPSDPWCKIASTNLSRQTLGKKQKRPRQVIEIQKSLNLNQNQNQKDLMKFGSTHNWKVLNHFPGKPSKNKHIHMKIIDDQLRIIDEVPTSAVEMQVKEKVSKGITE